MKLPETLAKKILQRTADSSLRRLPAANVLTDFSSNDYLGFAKSETIFDRTHQFLLEHKIKINGATGSRLLSGNHTLFNTTEQFIAQFHQSESALLFNSGYDANIGFFGSVPQRNDVILFDELSHASIRDGIKNSNAKSFKFNHNDLEDLEIQIRKNTKSLTYVVTESVFSMDGDSPNLEELAKLCKKHNCFLIVDEAHALGVFGEHGEGLVQSLNIHHLVFARIVTFGKSLGCHGAAILGSSNLKEYLVNFARSFIYTTALSPHAVATILFAYYELQCQQQTRTRLKNNIVLFNQQKQILGLKPLFIYSKSAIQSAIVQGNEKVKSISVALQKNGFDVKPILSPTVPEGQERLRFCLHSYNSEEEISGVLELFDRLIFTTDKTDLTIKT